MSLHRSLQTAGALMRHRNVLTRTERLERLDKEKRRGKNESVLGLPKVRSIKAAKKKKKKAEEGEAEAAPTEA